MNRNHNPHSLNRLLFATVLMGPLLAGGCSTTEEEIQKSKGYYQEGVASLAVDRQKAFVSFQRAVQVNPKNKEAHYGLGHIYAQQGKFNQAEEEFRTAIGLDEDYSEAHAYLGQVLVSQGRWSEAINSYKSALGNPLYPTPDLARFHLARALAHEGELQAAMEAYEDALLVNPPSVPPALLHLELGQIYYKLGFQSRAKDTLNKVTSLDKGGEYAAAAADLLARLKH